MRRLAPILALAALLACPASGAAQEKQLPRGGTELFPGFRVVAYAGTPGVTSQLTPA